VWDERERTFEPLAPQATTTESPLPDTALEE
jgi:hypothetical protein